jgi:hypothetical protein
MAAGAVIGVIVGVLVGFVGRNYFWIPTATAIGIGIGLVIEVSRGPNP